MLSTSSLILGSGILSGNGNNLYYNGNSINGNIPTTTGFATTGLYTNPFVINWSGNNTFEYNLTGNTTFSFTGCTNGQTVVVGIYNSSSGNVSWPSGTTGVPSSISGIRWPGNSPPTGSTGGYYDIYTFIDLNNVIFGNVILGF